ncbi:MAG: tagaturonate epimerase family protein [Bacteroidota bacterium]
MKKLGKYSIGMGDRFGHQGHAQLRAITEAEKKGIEITPVWNKSNREHNIIGTEPGDARKEADEVTRKAGFDRPYFVDADHINLDTVDRFIESSDFFTIDVASYIGKRAGNDEVQAFFQSAEKYAGKLKIPGIKKPFEVTMNQITEIAYKYLFAAIKAWEIFRKIEKLKGKGNFITEVSMDEVPHPQTPVELFFILRMLGDENIPVQTIAPKFSGRFNKGVDYVGDTENFEEEFEADLMVIDYAVHEFGLPGDLKMSIHSGSDKFKLYPIIGSLVKKHNKGFHLKTAGTTWLEEIIGLAESGGEALEFVREIYCSSLEKTEELCSPYADMIDISISKLPSKAIVSGWSARKFADSLRHVSGNPSYNPNMRQLVHVAYKMAAERKEEYFRLLKANEKTVSKCVFENMYNRHICRLFDI